MGSGGERAKRAIEVMKQMGFSSSGVLPVLKNLLKACENCWEHIESENYSLLIEAILEADVSKARDSNGTNKNGQSIHDTVGNKRGTLAEEPESHRKRSKQRQDDTNRSSPSVSIAHKSLPKTINSEICDSLPMNTAIRDYPSATTSTHSNGVGRTKPLRQRPYECALTHRSPGKAKNTKSRNEPIMCKPLSVELPVPRIHPPLAFPSIEEETPNHKGRTIDRSQEPSRELAIVSLHGPLFDRPTHDLGDISKGQEKVQIPIVNEFPGEQCPPHFTYIASSITYQNAYLNFSLARIGDEDYCVDCFKDCLSVSLPCACARETGGEFAYTPGGLLKSAFLDECIAMRHNPPENRMVYCKDCPLERVKDDVCPEECNGHLVRKFIKECWRKCGCHSQCGNRVVQQGIWCNLQVFWTPSGKGWGLRTTDALPRGAFVCEYVGEVLTNTELYERTLNLTRNARHTYPVLLDADWGSEGVLKDEEALCLDGTFYGNVARFINHRCFDANLVEVPVEIETPDRHFYHVAFFTSRKIDAFEELTWDYGIDFNDHNHPIKAFQCHCGSNECRDKSRTSVSGKKPGGISIN